MTGPGMMRCLPYRCDLEAVACGHRHRTAADGDSGVRIRLSHCVGCGTGKAAAKANAAILRTRKIVKKGRRWNPDLINAQAFAESGQS